MLSQLPVAPVAEAVGRGGGRAPRSPAGAAAAAAAAAEVGGAGGRGDARGDDPAPGATCAVCLEPLGTGQLTRRLPCLHVFHVRCIDRWLWQHHTCPVDGLDVVALATQCR